MQSPIYWHPFLYRAAMKLAYGKRFSKRYHALTEFIPEGCALFEPCMGDARLYLDYLKKKNVNYSCGDVNPHFVNAARRKGIDAVEMNLMTETPPQSDYILLHASLSYFIPNEEKLIAKLFSACNKELIISESIDNMSNSSSGFTSMLGTWLSKAKVGQSKIKFTATTLKKAFAPFEANIKVWKIDPDNREIIIVLAH